MNNFRLVNVIILCVILFSLFSEGCDKDKSPTKPKRDTALVGIWKLTKITWECPSETVTYTESQLDEMGYVWTIEIKDDGTFEQTSNMSDMIESGPPETHTGTWSTSANQLAMTFTIQGETGTIVYEYTIDGNIVILTRESPTGDMRIISEFTKQ